MTRLPAWFIRWLRGWPATARQSRVPTHLDAALAEVVSARASRDPRRLHAAHQTARRERTHALARELGREAFLQ